MSLQPTIDLLAAKIESGDILTPREMKDVHTLLTGIRCSGKLIPDEKIQSVAFAAAHNVCETGSPNSLCHNSKTIAGAIRSALQ